MSHLRYKNIFLLDFTTVLGLVFHLSLFYTCTSIQPQVDVPMVVEELLKYIQHTCHLSENEDSVRSCLQLSKQKVECLQLTCTQINSQLNGLFYL